ncbi:hypothetical protein JCM9140_3083 [Halalkalibacter wakoensis JCM 9140]|uniref:Uncharacterized protein n=1 Tax=Halalkalibacter wakoensis JCM 9140 TaxID=1236970 RepID=W4Q5L1_9BACI|nr:hypothetical protein [Halalkalibacter wakoensis]GAE26973.1 hypothetical protein JCM9140_3083 [Halalkalibacter wakoensis JCM 9140]
MPLENLLEFIVQNFIFVAVVIGGLISMFGRMAGAGQQQQEKRGNAGERTRQPQTQDDQVDWRDIFKQEEIEPASPGQIQVETTHLDRTDEIADRQQQIKDQYDQLRKKRKETSYKASELRSDTETPSKKGGLDLHLNRLTNEEAMKAVVWAEVLGRPRARQPHNTFSKRRF